MHSGDRARQKCRIGDGASAVLSLIVCWYLGSDLGSHLGSDLGSHLGADLGSHRCLLLFCLFVFLFFVCRISKDFLSFFLDF